MNETELILTRLDQTFNGDAWHGSSLLEALKNIDEVQAIVRPIEDRHTIWEIVNHCSYWMEAVTNTLKGEEMVNIESTEDWSMMGETKNEWIKDLERLRNVYEHLVSSIKNFKEKSLDESIESDFGGRHFTFTYRKMLHGISDHNTYHAGQISIIRKGTI